MEDSSFPKKKDVIQPEVNLEDQRTLVEVETEDDPFGDAPSIEIDVMWKTQVILWSQT